MRFLTVVAGVALISAGSAGALRAQTLGDVGAASAIAGTMGGAGQGGTMAVGSRAMSDARGIGPAYNQRMGQAMQEGGGMGTMGGGGGPGYYAGAPGGAPGAPGGAPGAPGVAPPGASGAAGEGGGPGFPDPNVAGVAPPPRREPIRWGKETGEKMLSELLARPTRGRGTGRNPRGSGSRYGKMSPKQVARLPKPTRTRIVAEKYKKKPVGYLSYYLPEDRFKLTSGLWKYVSVEDDRARYPVRHYYRPDSPVFLNIVSRRARGTQPRFNRVIGFASWQDALIAGYRPDPISKPSPGVELAAIAGMAPREDVARYAEFLYAGQIAPQEFARTYAYIQRVRRVINSRQDTRRFLRPTVGRILLAALGEGSVPRTVGGTPRAVVTTTVTAPGAGGPPPGYSGPGGPPPGSGSSVPPPGYATSAP
jgi:hypothetical protein